MRPTSWTRASHRGLLTAFALVSVLLCGACTMGKSPHEAAPPTPIARLNTTVMRLPRIDFCSLVQHSSLARALAAKRWKTQSFRNGDKEPVGDSANTTTDVVAEHACRWTAANGNDASAWVFATPVDKTYAAQLVRDNRQGRGCHTVAGPSFGDPSVTQVCRTHGRVRVRHAGLFKHSWFTCQVDGTGRVADVRKRADAWCVSVATTLNTRR